MSRKTQFCSNISKTYLSDPQRFAQICNNTLFSGQQIILAEGLSELDPHEVRTTGWNRKEVESLWKDRDILKSYQDQYILAILGIENQTDIHYCMPQRCLLYDALNYERQRVEIRKKHDREKDLKGAEYISGYAKTDRMIPVFTIVIYFGEDPWDGPRTLHEMLDLPEGLEEYKSKLMDYQLNLVEVNRMENLEQYEGELKAFFGFLKYHSDQEQMDQFIQENQAEFSDLPCETVQAMAVMGNMKEMSQYLQLEEADTQRKGTVNMGNAWEDMKETCRREGHREGGIYALVRENIDEGNSTERIVMKLKKYFALTEEQSLQYIERYGEKQMSS